jgi:serine-type D-Ala-D-Ala carboxypeptidase (penicillin-binding protein 5/6)
MSSSPFLTPGQSRTRRNLAAARRRRRRRLLAGGLVLCVLIGLGVEMALANGSSKTPPHTTQTAHAHGAGSPVPAPAAAHSQTGLPLAKPALALTGISSPASDPVHTLFHAPPRAGILFNLTTGQVLWQRNAYKRVRIASLTKMMTALLAVQSAPPGAHVLVTREAVNMPGSKVGVLPVGKHVRLESMLYGLLLPSGNDAAVALAQHVAGSVHNFVSRMNDEAAKLGMGCTRYSSPSGYYDQGNYSCAADLAILAHVDIDQPRIARVTHTYSAVLPFPIKGGKLYLYNNNPLLIYKYPGATGMKTGYTEAAGRCLVATAERHGVRLGAIVLDSTEPGIQASDLLDRGFEDVYHQRPVPAPALPPGA